MKKTTYFLLFLLFFSTTSSVVYAQAPSDENFDDNTAFDVTSNDFALDGVRYQISGNGSTYRHATFNNTFNLSEDGASDYALQFDKNGNGGISTVTISANNGSTFQITGMSMDILSDTPIQFTSDNGGDFSLNANDGPYVLHKNYDFTAQSGFDNITKLTISGTNMVVDIDDLNFEPAVLPATTPTVSTSAATSITATGGAFNGEVTNDGGTTVTARGFVYSSTDNTPTIGEGGVNDMSDGSGTGVFDETISGLSSSTTYYYQAYATNSVGTVYGGVESFTTDAVPIASGMFWNDDFEDPTSPSSGTRTPSNNGGISSAYFKRATNADLDLALVSDGNYSNFQGSYFWAGEDHDGPFTNPEQNIVWGGIDITGKANITFKGLFGAQSSNDTFENVLAGHSHTDYVVVEYSIDGGSYLPLISFYSTTDIANKKLYEDTNNDGIGDGTLLTKSFNEFTKPIVGTGNQLAIRLRAYSNNTNNEEWAVDNFRLETAGPSTTLATVTTVAASGVTTTKAVLGGEVTDNGNAAVTDRGIVYNTIGTPNVDDDTKVEIGSGNGSFTQQITGLTAGTTYYVRAYATNSEGTSYGGEESFTTSVPNAVPIVDANTGLTVTEGTTGTIDSGKLHFNDDETEDDAQLTATITSAVTHGTLFLDANLSNTFDAGDEVLTISATFAQDDVNNDRLKYTNTVGGQTSDSFVFTLSDPDGGELTNQAFSITINQAPTVTVNNGLNLNEGTTELIDSGKLNVTDAETGGGTDITFTVTSAVSHGVLFIDSNPSNVFEAGDVELVENVTFTLDDINNDRLRYTNTVADQNADSFEFKVSDPDGGELTNQTFTITINLLEVPTVTTTAASGVTATTATLGGEVTDTGGDTVTERGIVYNTTGSPTTSDTKVQIGSGDGSFTQEITGLTAGTEYFVRAYAINSEGTSYGDDVSFITTKIQLAISNQNLTTSKSYDGTNNATVSDIVLSGVHPGDDVTITGEAIYDNASVGENKTITVVYTLGGADGNPSAMLNNLTLGGGETTSDKNFANISKWAQQFTASESGIISSLKLNLYRANSQSGSFTVELWSGTGTIPTSQLVILKTLDWSNVPLNNAAITTADFVELTNLENSYSVVSGTKYWIVVSQPSNGPFAKRWAVNGSGNETASYNANQDLWTGNGTALDLGYQIEIETPGSYIAPMDFVVNDGVITAKELTITGLIGNNKSYDGTSVATVSGTAILNGVETGDEVTLGGTPVFTFENANVGIGIDIIASGYEISGADSGNYYLTAPSGLSADITATAPTVSTTASSGVTTIKATLGGEVTNNGGAIVTDHGIVYNTLGTPNVDDDTKVQIGSGDGSFTQEITGLTAETTYYVRAYATNSEGTSYGGEVSFTTDGPDTDGTLTAAAMVTEPVSLSSTYNTMGKAVDLLDFTLSDGGGSDGQATMVSQIEVNVAGTSTDVERSQVTWRLNGPDASNVTGAYNAETDKITFSGLSISVADGGNETYIINAYFNDNTGLTEDHTIILSVEGDTNLTIGASGTQMASSQSAVTNGSGTRIDILATQLVFTTQPSGSVSGSALSMQPVVSAQDAFGNTDVDFTETVTLTEASAGSLSGDMDMGAVSGVATFTDVVYTATSDQESFKLTANDEDGIDTDLLTVDANLVTSDVVATKLSFTTEPAPTSVQDGVQTSFTIQPVVAAMDINNVVDTGYSTDIVLTEVNGSGSAILSGTGDTDGDGASVSLSPFSGVATFTGLQITYNVLGSSNETFNLRASSGGLTTINSTQLTAIVNTAPAVTTTAASGVTATAATLGGEVTDNGGATVTERGIVYNTSGEPNVDDDTKVEIGSGDGSFTQGITGLSSGTEYFVRAYAINSEGTSYGGEESFITSTLGLEDGYLKNAISLYPNPVNDVLHLKNTVKLESVVLFDVLGKRIDTIKMENDSINVSNLETGIYLLKIETENGNVIKRIIKE